MQKQFIVVLLFLCFACIPALAADPPATQPAAQPIKLLVVTGGHGFKHDPFFQLFKDIGGGNLTVTEAAEENDFKKTTATAYDRTDLASYDVVLLYDFQLNITPEQKKNFLALFDKGTGLIVLHHALLSYQAWPEYERIAGGSYLLDTKAYGATTLPASTYQGDVDMHITIADRDHPVTAGLSDFDLKDEIYRGVPTGSDIHPLLITEGKPLAWSRTEKNSRIVSIILGHGAGSYNNPSFQKLLSNSIHWTAKR